MINGHVICKLCMASDKSLPTFIYFFIFKAILICPAVASISIYHLLKVRVITIINPVNRWPRGQGSIYRPLFKSAGKLVPPKSEWGNYFNHLRPSVSDWCVCEERADLLHSDPHYQFPPFGSILSGDVVLQKTFFYTQAGSGRSVWNRHMWAATCAGVRPGVSQQQPLRSGALWVQGDLLPTLARNEPLITFSAPLPHIPPSRLHFALITNSGPLSALHSSHTLRGLQLPFHVLASSNLFFFVPILIMLRTFSLLSDLFPSALSSGFYIVGTRVSCL